MEEKRRLVTLLCDDIEAVNSILIINQLHAGVIDLSPDCDEFIEERVTSAREHLSSLREDDELRNNEEFHKFISEIDEYLIEVSNIISRSKSNKWISRYISMYCH